MSGSRMTDDDFFHRLNEMVEEIKSVKDNRSALQRLIDQYKDQLTSVQLGELLAQAITEDVKASTLCECVTDLHDEVIYIALLDETFGGVFASIPVADRTYKVCMHAVAIDGMLIANVPAELIDEAMAQQAVENTGKALQYLPLELRTREICETALSHHDAWEIIPYIPEDLLTDDMIVNAIKDNYNALFLVNINRRTHDMYVEVARQNSDILNNIPDAHYSFDICRQAVLRNAHALKLVKSNLLEREQYLQLVNLSLFNDPSVLIEMPRDFLSVAERKNIFDDDMCLSVVKKNGAYLAGLSKSERTREVCLAALEDNPVALLSLNWKVFSDIEIREIVKKAVEKNPLLLEYVPEKYKKECIDDLSPEYLLMRNYMACIYMPDEYEERVQKFFSGVKHAAICDLSEHELADVYLVYASTGSREGKIICADREHYAEMLGLLKECGATDLNLILIGHASKSSDQITGVTLEDMTDILQKNEEINRVTLMGCNTAKAKVLDEELKIIERFRQEHTDLSDCAFALMSGHPKNVDDIIMPLKQSALYLLVKGNDADMPYTLYHYKRDNKEASQFTTHRYPLKKTGYDIIRNFLITGGKEFKFPKPGSIIMLRGGKHAKSPASLSVQELRVMQDASHNRERTSKASPHYRRYKDVAAFLANVTIEGDEILKLKNSLLKKLVTAIEAAGIKRNLTIKGYAQAVHVDTKENRLHTARTKLYTSDYTSSFFGTKTETIDREKLKGERSAMMTGFLRSDDAAKKGANKKKDSTRVKSIKVKLTGKK